MKSRFLIALILCSAGWAQTTTPQAPENSKPAAAAASAPAESDLLKPAEALLKERKYQEAATAFQAIVEKNPATAGAHVGLMRSLLRMREFDEAETAAKAGLAAVPSSALVSATAGDVAFRAGKFAEAEAAYRSAMKLDNKSARAWYGMGRMFDMVSMHRQAKNAFARAHELDPADRQIASRWRETLPYAERLKAAAEGGADLPPSEIQYLTAVAQKKPWVLATEINSTEIKMLPYGKELVQSRVTASEGAMTISRGYGLNVKFNDRTSAVLLLDTGAGGITVGRKLAEKAGVVKIADSYIYGIGDKGIVSSYIGWVDKISIGNVEFHNCIVEVSSKTDIADEAGLIGADVFADYLVTLDFKEWKLHLGPLPRNPNAVGGPDDPQDRYIAPEMQAFTRIWRFGHNLMIPVVVSDQTTGNFILDTGAMTNHFTPRIAEQVTKLGHGDWIVKGVSGKVSSVQSGDKAILQFARIRARSDDFPVSPLDNLSDGEGTEIAGLIGIKTLVQMKMTIDYRDGLVNLEVYNFKPARE